MCWAAYSNFYWFALVFRNSTLNTTIKQRIFTMRTDSGYIAVNLCGWHYFSLHLISLFSVIFMYMNSTANNRQRQYDRNLKTNSLVKRTAFHFCQRILLCSLVNLKACVFQFTKYFGIKLKTKPLRKY